MTSTANGTTKSFLRLELLFLNTALVLIPGLRWLPAARMGAARATLSDFAVEPWMKFLLSFGGTLKRPRHEPSLEAAAERTHAALFELKQLGIVDEKGTAFARISRKIWKIRRKARTATSAGRCGPG